MRALTVLIPDAEDPLALRAVRSLGRVPGIKTHLLAAERYASARFSRFCHRWHFAQYPMSHPQRCAETLALLAKQPVDVVLPVSVQGTRMVVEHSTAFAACAHLPPLPGPQCLGIADDKVRLSCFARQHAVPVPPFLVFPDDLAESDAVQRLAFPVLAKHPSMAGGKGIALFADAASLTGYLNGRATTAANGRLLLQSYVAGDDFGLNVLCRDGRILAHTIQHNPIRAGAPFGPAAGICFVDDPQVLEVGQTLVAALGYSGLANIDLRRCASSGELYVLEMNPRLWATSMGSTFAGVNFPYLACLAAMGRPLPKVDYRHITYADKAATFEMAKRYLHGDAVLPGFRFRHTAPHLALLDPLPMLVDNVKQLWKTRVLKLWKRSERVLPRR